MKPAESRLLTECARGTMGRPVYRFACAHRDCGKTWSVGADAAELTAAFLDRAGLRPDQELLSQRYVGGTQKTRGGARIRSGRMRS